MRRHNVRRHVDQSPGSANLGLAYCSHVPRMTHSHSRRVPSSYNLYAERHHVKSAYTPSVLWAAAIKKARYRLRRLVLTSSLHPSPLGTRCQIISGCVIQTLQWPSVNCCALKYDFGCGSGALLAVVTRRDRIYERFLGAYTCRSVNCHAQYLEAHDNL